MKTYPILNGKRKCSKCGRVKLLSEFHKNRALKAGIFSWCKSCGNRLVRGRRKKRLKHYREMEAKKRERNRVSLRLWHRNRRIEMKRKIIKHYGGRCKCCGEDRIEFLAIDHIGGGGKKHRKEVGSGNMLYWIIKNNYPKGFRILCHNCNMSLGIFGYSPACKNLKQ